MGRRSGDLPSALGLARLGCVTRKDLRQALFLRGVHLPRVGVLPEIIA
jgi:hypothetical protein